ncbi:Phosphoribosylformylglycinamidine synthase subunit PurQ [Dirofilaria immitis]
MFDIVITTSTSILVGCINFVTLHKIKKAQKLKQSKVKNFVKRKCDILFFKQADNNICFLYSRICGLAMIITALIFNIGQHFLTNKWALFAVTTVSWQVANSLDRSLYRIYAKTATRKKS